MLGKVVVWSQFLPIMRPSILTSLSTRFDPHLIRYNPQTRICHCPDGVVLRLALPSLDPTSPIRFHRMVVVRLSLEKRMGHHSAWKVGTDHYGEVFSQRATQAAWFRNATVCVLRKRAKEVCVQSLWAWAGEPSWPIEQGLWNWRFCLGT